MLPNQFNYSLIGNLPQPLIIFLHGFMGNMDEFNQIIELLSEDFSFLILDLPGHGKSQVFVDNNNYKIEYIAESLINLLNHLNIDECFLVGYSMGGRLALYLTLHFPTKFIKVILASSSPGLKTDRQRLLRREIDAQIANQLISIMNKNDFANFLDYWYSQEIFGDIKSHPKYLEMLEIRLGNNPVELAKSLQFMGTGSQISLWEKLGDNQVPLLLLTGEYDRKFMAINREMNDECNLIDMIIIPQAGHNIHLQNPSAFGQSIRDFFMNFRS